jgi:DNA-binding transcriptional ArsR family regulator
MHLLDAEDESAERAAEFLRTVAHAGRLRIVCALMEGERSASDLACHARLPAPALSQQAAILEAKGVIARRRVGRSVLYRLAAPEAKTLAKLLYRMFCKAPVAPRRASKRRKP